MNFPDLINGCFEFLAGGFSFMNVWRLYKDKGVVSGVYWPAWVLFTAWGWWNCYYYPHLAQWYSFTGGLLIVVANTTWLAVLLWYAVKYRHGPKQNLAEPKSQLKEIPKENPPKDLTSIPLYEYLRVHDIYVALRYLNPPYIKWLANYCNNRIVTKLIDVLETENLYWAEIDEYNQNLTQLKFKF